MVESGMTNPEMRQGLGAPGEKEGRRAIRMAEAGRPMGAVTVAEGARFHFMAGRRRRGNAAAYTPGITAVDCALLVLQRGRPRAATGCPFVQTLGGARTIALPFKSPRPIGADR
jgi:hypothetical protein